MIYIKSSNIGDIMRKILLILALMSSAFVAAQERPFQAFFELKLTIRWLLFLLWIVFQMLTAQEHLLSD